MSIWAIADIHASRRDPETGRPVKPMDVFGPRWVAHLDRLKEAWSATVCVEDTVIVAGDIDWAMYVDDARETLLMLDSLPGRKILLRGNHDYWWSSKTTNRVRRLLPASLTLLHNNALTAEGFNICGAKGSTVPGGIDWTPQDEKILKREQQRLLLSLEARNPDLPTIVALHYPPFYPSHQSSPYRELLETYGVSACVYGHLHGDAAHSGPLGCYGGVEYFLVAGDAGGFAPVQITRNNRIIPLQGVEPSELSAR